MVLLIKWFFSRMRLQRPFRRLNVQHPKNEVSAELSWSLIITPYRPITHNNAFTLNPSWSYDCNEGVGFWPIWGFLLPGDFQPRQVKKRISIVFPGFLYAGSNSSGRQGSLNRLGFNRSDWLIRLRVWEASGLAERSDDGEKRYSRSGNTKGETTNKVGSERKKSTRGMIPGVGLAHHS